MKIQKTITVTCVCCNDSEEVRVPLFSGTPDFSVCSNCTKCPIAMPSEVMTQDNPLIIPTLLEMYPSGNPNCRAKSN